ncbi:MAG: Jag N-terminal domain-containing protein [Elusimicrobia bacterium]|nr:Jag N-terminal domain-containing protein [Elusimicrobiota bacterium]
MEGSESEGRTVAEAVEGALKKLNLRRDQVEVQIIQEAAPGFMGFGAKPARVRVFEKRWGQGADGAAAPAPEPAGDKPRRETAPAKPQAAARPREQPVRQKNPPVAKPAERAEDEPARPADTQAACAAAVETLREILALMEISASDLPASWDGQQERVKIKVDAPDADRLIGSEGRVLEALQFLLTLLVHRKLGYPVAVQVDAMGHWEKQESEILSQVQRAIDEAKRSGKPYRLNPMEPAMRRLVHRTLAEHPEVETASEGEGQWRKVVIRPRKR